MIEDLIDGIMTADGLEQKLLQTFFAGQPHPLCGLAPKRLQTEDAGGRYELPDSKHGLIIHQRYAINVNGHDKGLGIGRFTWYDKKKKAGRYEKLPILTAGLLLLGLCACGTNAETRPESSESGGAAVSAESAEQVISEDRYVRAAFPGIGAIPPR